jgi:adenosylcobinamide kinase/adenosylcobinamide-phosphate guanylyltransferase
MAVVLLAGGARSGKSELACNLAIARGGPTVFVATARAGDDEMQVRIARHRAQRPSGWRTIEEPVELAAALSSIPDDSVTVLDCLTLWVSNLMLEGLDDEAIEACSADALAVAARPRGDVIVVTNEVGSGVHPPTGLGRRFQDVLGRVNVAWSRGATDAFLVVAGRVLALSDSAALVGPSASKAP